MRMKNCKELILPLRTFFLYIEQNIRRWRRTEEKPTKYVKMIEPASGPSSNAINTDPRRDGHEIIAFEVR